MMRNLKRLRIKRGLTQADVADLVGVTPGAVWHWENTHARPTEVHQELLAMYFQVPHAFLEDRRREPRNDVPEPRPPHLRRVA